MEHSDLVAEMTVVERMSTQERLKHARKRRIQQLKRWNQREKEHQLLQQQQQQGGNGNTNKRKKMDNGYKTVSSTNKKNYKVHFVPSVMLLEAAARNDVDEVRRLLMLGVSPDSTNEDGLTALHQCCIDDSEEMMRLLLEFGANVNAKDSEQWTPLHAAATCGHLHLVKHLVSIGHADLLAVNTDGNMPYDICEDEATLDYIESEMAKTGITQEMIDETRSLSERKMLSELKNYFDNGGDLEYRDQQGATPLHIAAANGYINVVEFLLDNHVSTDVCDNDLWQPIHAAACWGHPDVIEFLVIAGADLNAKTKNGETPFDICEDPDLKDRILQLKNEMETKRASQPQKLKRSQSQNTRSQSVRRTSIRDKSLMSRREAREEARLRHEKQDQNITDEDDEAKIQHDMRITEKDSIVIPVTFNNIDMSVPIIPSKDTLQRIKSKTKDNDEAEDNYLQSSIDKEMSYDKDHNLQQCFMDCNMEMKPTMKDCDETSTIPANDLEDSSVLNTPVTARSQAESVKVEIHVTVNTSPTYPLNHGTLADLKKHRSDMRSRSSLTLGSSQQDLTNKVISHNGHMFKTTYLYEKPPSPTISLRRFCSDPSEIVGEPHKHGCCTIM